MESLNVECGSRVGRRLNDYESMLVRSTCNIGLSLTVPKATTVEMIKEAWQLCVARYELLQVCFVLDDSSGGGMGVLGPRYKAVPTSNMMIQIDLSAPPTGSDSSSSALVKQLQHAGCTALDPSQCSYILRGFLWSNDDEQDCKTLEFILSLSHAVSDGPGALQLAHTFLQDIESVLFQLEAVERSEAESSPPHSASERTKPLLDLQARILGADYGANTGRNEAVYQELKSFQENVAKKPSERSANFLLPEAMQGLPASSKADAQKSGCIDCVEVSLTEDETANLRKMCRSVGATIQGAISAASLVTRIQMLGIANEKTFIECVIQVPMNSRKLLSDGDVSEAQDVAVSCLCGSAGVVHSVRVPPQNGSGGGQLQQLQLLALAKECTDTMRNAMEKEQPVEWLRRLLHNPSSLPKYSLMASSIGVAPITRDGYGPSITVTECHFFGASLETSPQAQGTMVHAITFNGRLQIMNNFTSPGIDRSFVEMSSERLKVILLAMARCDEDTRS